MAEAARNRLPSGYDDDFVGAFEDDVLCVICQLPLKEPVLTRCGHRYCKECLEEHFRRQGIKDQPLTCPADREGLNRDREVFPDKATERKILSLAIKCPSEGCAWTGELRSKETHLSNCPLRDVPCTNDNCQVTLKRKDLSEHVSVTCQWKIVLCEFCREPHPKCQMEDHVQEKCKLRPLPCPYQCGAVNLRDKDLQDHLETCERFPVRCPNKCDSLISREMVSNHIEDYCPLTKIPCPYARMGCRTEVQRDQLESHIECATKSHLDLVCGELRDTQEKLEEKIIHFDGLEERVNILHEQLEENVNDIQHQHQNNVDLIQQQHQRRVNILQEQLEQKVKTCQRRLEQKTSMERKMFLVCLVLGLVFLAYYLTKIEDRVHKHLEEKLSVIQSLHGSNVGMVRKDLEDVIQKKLDEKVSIIENLEDRVQKHLEEKLSVIQSLHESKVGVVGKDLEDLIQKKLHERVSIIKNLEDRVQKHQHQQQHQRRVNILQEQLKPNAKACQTKLERKVFLVCLVLGLVFLAYFLTKIECSVQKNFEEKLTQILEDRNQKHLEEKLSLIQSLHESKVSMVRKDLEDGIQKKLDDKDSIIINLERKVQTKLKEEVSLIQSLNERIAKLEMDPEASRIFIWKVTNFENQVKKDSCIESVPFYAYGYKLVLGLYPNGNGEVKNTHLSIFICVMKGEYDAILPWGFSKKVTFTLIDQQDSPDQRRDIAEGFTANPNLRSFRKPVEGEDRVGRGFKEFVPHSDLRTRRFIVDDTIIIKVQVAETS